jgi:hypothetical protein
MDKQNEKIIYQNINEISFYFFVILGIVNVISGLLLANEISVRESWLINRLLDLPFFMVTFLYFFSLHKLNLIKKQNFNHFADILVIAIGGLITLALIIYDLSIPNQIPVL